MHITIGIELYMEAEGLDPGVADFRGPVTATFNGLPIVGTAIRPALRAALPEDLVAFFRPEGFEPKWGWCGCGDPSCTTLWAIVDEDHPGAAKLIERYDGAVIEAHVPDDVVWVQDVESVWMEPIGFWDDVPVYVHPASGTKIGPTHDEPDLTTCTKAGV